MTRTMLIGAAMLSAAAVFAGHLNSQTVAASRHGAIAVNASAGAGAQVSPIGGIVGPDVTIGAILAPPVHWTSAGAVDGLRAYSLGGIHCNIGSDPLANDFETVNHPLRAQNMYRLHGGRFEQIGQSWLFFHFCDLQQSFCGTCAPACSGCCDQLGVGCSSSNTASRSGSSPMLGPKDQTVNPATGAFTVSHPAPQGPAVLSGRLQVHESDLLLADFPGARYFAEMSEIAPDDAFWGNNNNNASWREMSFNQTTFAAALLSTGADAVGGTNREEVALMAWQEFDADAGPQPSVGVTIANADVPNDGRFVLGYEVTNNGNGTWTYEYALLNSHSDRSAQAFSVPVPAGVNVTNVGFHDVDYHSFDADNGSLYDLTDWSANQSGGTITWSGAPFAANQLANALRWGTLYNFRFTADAAPHPVSAVITLFKPGAPDSVLVMTHGPQTGAVCAADLDDSGLVDGIDLGILLAQFFAPGGGSADLDGSGSVNGVDLGILLNSWGGSGCEQ